MNSNHPIMLLLLLSYDSVDTSVDNHNGHNVMIDKQQ